MEIQIAFDGNSLLSMKLSNRIKRNFQEIRYRKILQVMRIARSCGIKTRTPVFLPRLLDSCESATVLSLSPHPDDDILAVGGTLHGHIHAGGVVHSIVLTNGDRGNFDASRQDGLTDVRRNEAKAAADVVGFSQIEFWDQPDGGLRATPALVGRMTMKLRSLNPDIIYLPFPVDYHYDHLETIHVLIQALKQFNEQPIIRCYECVIPLIPNLLVDITSWKQVKRDAIDCFASQNAVSDYVRTILEGLNKLRTHGILHGKGYAEALFETRARFLEKILLFMLDRSG